jgi:transcriptional regulator with XRE-family HTH domain
MLKKGDFMTESLDIKTKRKELKLSQVELAAKVGVSLMTIQLWERGAMNPSPDNMEKLLNALNPIPFAEE